MQISSEYGTAMKPILLPVAVLVLAATVCTPPPQKRAAVSSVKVEEEIRTGNDFLRHGDWRSAAAAYDRALKANPSAAEARAGLAYILALRGHHERALANAEAAVRQDSLSAAVRTFQGRVLTAVKPDGWFEKAEAAFTAAKRLQPRFFEADFYFAEALEQAGRFVDALQVYADLAEEEDPYFSPQARERIQPLLERLDLSPRSAAGRRLLLSRTLTRSDLAELLVRELDLPRLLRRRNAGGEAIDQSSAKPVTDIADDKAADEIRTVVAAGVMDVYPDGRFRPQQTVSRLDAAMVFQQTILRVTGDTSLDTAFIGSSIAFSDVKASHYGYNAACLTTQRGILSFDQTSGSFRPNEPLTGIEAIAALHRLESMFRR